MNIILKYFILITAFASLTFTSCKEKEKASADTTVAADKGTYFSIKKFSLDEWETHAGEPITFQKTIVENGKTTDTGYVNAEHMDWISVLKIFTETDISDRSFLGKYSFTQFEDSLDNTHNFLYLANDKDLFTQKLLITMDINTMQLRGVFIETFKKTFWNETHQKLYYAPVAIIQMQEYENPLIGPKKEKITKYEAVR